MTPVELYGNIYVKREDLCFESPAPPFSKCRGIIPHLEKLKKQGITTVGYTETSISMAGWGVTWACKELGMKAIIFDPQYIKTPEVLEYHRKQWYKLGAEIIPIKAGMAKVNWYISKSILKKIPNSVLLPLGLPFKETIQETAHEFWGTLNYLDFNIKSIIVCVGSGTICSGIMSILNEWPSSWDLYGIMTRTGDVNKKANQILNKAQSINSGIFKTNNFKLVDPGWEYTQKSQITPPFPCHPYYDAKAWQWLIENEKSLKAPILFWNIGH